MHPRSTPFARPLPAGRTAKANRPNSPGESTSASCLFQAKWRFPLTHLDLRPRELMPVNEDVCARKSGAVRVDAITILEVAFDFEIELLGKIAGEIDSCAAQTKPIFQCRLTKASFERADITVF